MGFSFKGKNKAKVEQEIADMITGLERNGRFDYIIDMRCRDGDWIGTVTLFFHNRKY